ncbi:hypothetical protein GCM10010977_31180 [Citricoccus zhacaiensis]|uniref:Uncharacterized protein n=1 Tax=Citricoccus zhacaiensis TaxID=489142 RepID=A0ABQ2MC33_9MICC|nr:hypothetical protein [Citricoccus zhacaiensis]GGO49403.1 hypothetical protein GCM10010977_31180 [Citricoccus zhacaiensis]
MFQDWRRDRLTKRVKPGDGRPLKRFRWWQLLNRGLMHLRITGEDGQPVDYAVSVGYLGDAKTGEVMARLYLDGRLHAESKSPAVFPVPGGVIEVATSAFGLKRCHYVTEDGAARQLVPDSRSAEGRRARFDSSHPVWSRWIGVISLILIGIGVVLVLLELAEQLTAIPPVAESIGAFVSPVQLPLWLTITLGIGAVAGSTERALRLRYRWFLDGAAG